VHRRVSIASSRVVRERSSHIAVAPRNGGMSDRCRGLCRDQNRNVRSHARYHRAEARAEDRRTRLEPIGGWSGVDLEIWVRHGDEALALGVDEPEVAGARKPLDRSSWTMSQRRSDPGRTKPSAAPIPQLTLEEHLRVVRQNEVSLQRDLKLEVALVAP